MQFVDQQIHPAFGLGRIRIDPSSSASSRLGLFALRRPDIIRRLGKAEKCRAENKAFADWMFSGFWQGPLVNRLSGDAD
ncbi:MAG: hypothetical protein ACREBD_23430, partial [Blastocatellia bacterium]